MDGTTKKTAGGGEISLLTLRRYATQLWAQQRRHRIQHYDTELVCTCMRFWSVAGTAAFGIEGFNGACSCCGVKC